MIAKTLADLMRLHPMLELSGSEDGFDRYEIEPGEYAYICPDCGFITETPDLGCGHCGFGTVLYDFH